MKVHPQRTGALCANSHPGSYTGQDAFNDMLPVIERNKMEWYCCGNGQSVTIGLFQVSNTLDCMHDQKFLVGGGGDMQERKYMVRRLTPTECARLQGFPDWWVDGAEGSDSAIYKMWGNGIALPCAADVIGRLAKELDK